MGLDIKYFDINGKPLRIYGVGNSTDIIMYFDQCIRQKRDIAAFHFNDVFCEFEDLFYKDKSYKTAMASFKKWMRYSADKHGLTIVKGKADHIDRHDFGVRVIWTMVY